MMKPLFLIATLVLCGARTMAQVPLEGQSNAQLQSCLIGTLPQTWATFELTSDQLERVRRVQEACKEECEAAAQKKPADGISNTDGSFILSELRGILSAEQYRAWSEHCAQSGTIPPR